MANINVQSQLPLTPVAAPAAPKQSQAPGPAAQEAPKASAMAQDAVAWKDIPSSTRVKTAIATSFKKTVIPYTIGGAVAAPLAGAAFGAFVGLFAGTPGKGAMIGAKAMVKYIPHGAALGVAAAGVDAAVLGTAVGSAPDKASAMRRVGIATAVIGVLGAEDTSDLIGTGVSTAANTGRAARLFDQTEAALKKQ